MKILLLLLTLNLNSLNLTSTEKYVIDCINKFLKEKPEVVQRLPNNKLVIEYDYKKYLINDSKVENMYYLQGSEWVQSTDLKREMEDIVRQYSVVFVSYDFNGDKYIKIQKIDESFSYTVYYLDMHHDSVLNCDVYNCLYASVYVGEDFVMYTDTEETFLLKDVIIDIK